MNRPGKVRSFILIVVLSFAAPLYSQEEGEAANLITAVGMGEVKDGDIASARKAAIDDALRVAVGKRMGVYLKSSRQVDMLYSLKRDRVETQTEGVVESYEIQEEEAIGTVYRVRVKAKLRPDAIRAKHLDQVQAGLVIQEKFQVGKMAGVTSDIEMTVKNALSEAGMRLVPLPSRSSFGSSFEEQARAAKEASIDLLIAVKAETSLKDELGGLNLCRAIADVKVIKPYTQELFAAKRIREIGERRPELGDAAVSAMNKAGSAVADFLVAQMLKRSPGLIESRVFLYGVEGIRQVNALRNELSQEKSIRSVELKTYAEGTAVFLVRMEIKAKQKLGNYLIDIENIPITIEEEAPGWIQARIRARQ